MFSIFTGLAVRYMGGRLSAPTALQWSYEHLFSCLVFLTYNVILTQPQVSPYPVPGTTYIIYIYIPGILVTGDGGRGADCTIKYMFFVVVRVFLHQVRVGSG